MLEQDTLSNGVSSVENGATGSGAAERRSQSNNGRDVARSLTRNGTCDDAAKAMTNKVNLSSGFGSRPLNRLVQMALDQEIWTLGIDADAGKIRPISNALQPGVEFHQIKIGAQKSGDDDDSRAISARYAKTVVDRSGVQKEDLGGKQGLGPG
jgi:hypothetical protein